MKIRLLRDACCGADDQAGPLDMTLEVDPSQTLGDFIDAVMRTHFLQFSSTRHTITGVAQELPLVQVVALPGEPQRAVFLVAPSQPVGRLLREGLIYFRF